MAVMESHALEVVRERGRFRATCRCGWRALGRDASPESAEVAWGAHMYARGFRTRAAIDAVKATRETGH